MDVYIHRTGDIEIRKSKVLPMGEYMLIEKVVGDLQPTFEQFGGHDPTPVPTLTREWTLQGNIRGVQIFEER